MKHINIKQATFIVTVISTLLVSAKGTLSRKQIKSFGKTYYEYTVVDRKSVGRERVC